ncbi:ArsR/SmtB family transcription factor [Mangrovihabitans endophyticus]|uniref:Transcriptional regulator n=1 Tax=Mangrovihabitans endophyticus TaxID=1751298 RepID=A0A8J3C4W5_9ACTN|nr:winged helix-turn-helix domain-containing protein [Mangrovihabitans endophyticus]GGL09968.1 transcriptional regulator [Mangrovihabitans endophyticus]
MLRIHFTPEDLSRTHVAVRADPLWDAVLSLQMLHNGEGQLLFQAWRHQVRARPSRADEAILLSLCQPRGAIADLLTPAAGALGLEAGLDAVRSTPISRIRRDLTHLSGRSRLPSWTRLLAAGDVRALDRLAGALRSWHRVGAAPYQPEIDRALDADRAVRLRDAQVGGPERLLAGLPGVRWERPMLLSDYPYDRDFHLDGRGLLLMPSFFCWRRPITLIDPTLPPVLAYPVEHAVGWLAASARPDAGPDRALTALLGSTRAAVLDTVGRGPISTGDLARRVHISAPSASEHATVLREAGLIVTSRQGGRALHSLSSVGLALLTGSVPA